MYVVFRPYKRTFRLQEKPSALQRPRHKWNVYICFLFLGQFWPAWIRTRIPKRDPDPVDFFSTKLENIVGGHTEQDPHKSPSQLNPSSFLSTLLTIFICFFYNVSLRLFNGRTLTLPGCWAEIRTRKYLAAGNDSPHFTIHFTCILTKVQTFSPCHLKENLDAVY